MNLVRLIQQKPDERIIAVYRIYGLTKIGSIILFFILIILPFFLLTPLASRGLIGLIIFLLWLLGAGFYGARQLILWYFNVFVVTDRRAVDIDQRGFFDRLVSELSHQKIQVCGLWRSTFPNSGCFLSDSRFFSHDFSLRND